MLLVAFNLDKVQYYHRRIPWLHRHRRREPDRYHAFAANKEGRLLWRTCGQTVALELWRNGVTNALASEHNLTFGLYRCIAMSRKRIGTITDVSRTTMVVDYERVAKMLQLFAYFMLPHLCCTNIRYENQITLSPRQLHEVGSACIRTATRNAIVRTHESL